MCKVSVIIPTYKRPQFISEAIDSVLAQTINDVEIIVVDDNGLGTQEQLQNQLALKSYIIDGRITYIPHETNRNGSAARNTGINNAKGKYIAFLDDDDLFEPEKIEKQIEVMEKENSCACLCGFCRFFGTESRVTVPAKEDLTIPNIFLGNIDTCAGSCLIVHQSVVHQLSGFDVSFKRQQDLEFLIRVLSVGKVSIAPDVLVRIRMHEQNLSAPNPKNTVEQRTHFVDTFKQLIDGYEPAIRAAIIDYQYLEIAKVFLKNKEIKNAILWVLRTSHPIKNAFTLIKSIFVYFTSKSSSRSMRLAR